MFCRVLWHTLTTWIVRLQIFYKGSIKPWSPDVAYISLPLSEMPGAASPWRALHFFDHTPPTRLAQNQPNSRRNTYILQIFQFYMIQHTGLLRFFTNLLWNSEIWATFSLWSWHWIKWTPNSMKRYLWGSIFIQSSVTVNSDAPNLFTSRHFARWLWWCLLGWSSVCQKDHSLLQKLIISSLLLFEFVINK